jgi:TonB family protein
MLDASHVSGLRWAPMLAAQRVRAAAPVLATLALACASTPPPAAPEAAAVPVESAPSEPASSTPEAAQPAPVAAQQQPEPSTRTPSGARTKEEIQRVIAENRDKVRACYDHALAANPGIQGDLVVSFVIRPNGTVKQAEINWAESSLHVPELDACAADAVKGFKFPPSTHGLESKVDYPFNFNPPNPYAPGASPDKSGASPPKSGAGHHDHQ